MSYEKNFKLFLFCECEIRTETLDKTVSNWAGMPVYESEHAVLRSWLEVRVIEKTWGLHALGDDIHVDELHHQ